MIRVDAHVSVDSNAYITARGCTIPAQQRAWLQRVLDELLGCTLFDNVELLELEAQYEPADETSVVTLANLLHCCTMARESACCISRFPFVYIKFYLIFNDLFDKLGE